MPDTKISALPDAATIDGTEEVAVVQSATTKRATVDELLVPHNADTTSVHGISDTSALLTDSDVIDEDDMVSDSAAKVPTQQSVKAYVDGLTGTLATVAATGATEDLAFSAAGNPIVHDVTMDEACTFTFSGATTGEPWSMTVILRGAFTPTFPAAVDWAGGSAPTYAAPSVFEFLTIDGGTTVLGFAAGLGLA